MRFEKKAAGRVVRQLRLQKELSQEVLSGLAGIGRTHLSMIETGTKQPSFETIFRLAVALGLKPDELVAMIVEETKKIEEQEISKKEE